MNMDVFDKQYRIYRIILKIVGLWPYDKSIYVWIQRICFSMYFLIGVIFQVIEIILFFYDNNNLYIISTC